MVPFSSSSFTGPLEFLPEEGSSKVGTCRYHSRMDPPPRAVCDELFTQMSSIGAAVPLSLFPCEIEGRE